MAARSSALNAVDVLSLTPLITVLWLQTKSKLLAAKHMLQRVQASASRRPKCAAAQRQRKHPTQTAAGSPRTSRQRNGRVDISDVSAAGTTASAFQQADSQPLQALGCSLSRPHAPLANGALRSAHIELQDAHVGCPGGQQSCPSSQASQEEAEEGFCVICMESPPAILFNPCWHAIACAQKVLSDANACPMCRCEVQAAVLLASKAAKTTMFHA